MPERESLKRQHFKQFPITARRQQAGEADAGSAHIIPRPRIGPGRPEQADELVCPIRGHVPGAAQVAPPVLNRREITHTVFLDRLPEPVQPLVARLPVRGSLDQRSAAIPAAPSTPRRPKRLTKYQCPGTPARSSPPGSRHRHRRSPDLSLATFLISVTASFRRWHARWEPLHPNARERSRGLNFQGCFVAIE